MLPSFVGEVYCSVLSDKLKCPLGKEFYRLKITFLLIFFFLSFFLIFRSDLIDFDNLKRSNAHYNLQNAFNVAEKELGLTKLLDPEGEI